MALDFMSMGHSRGSNKNRQVELKGLELLAPDCQLLQDRSIHHVI